MVRLLSAAARRKEYRARAPIENPGPGKWIKWSGGGWDAPGWAGTGRRWTDWCRHELRLLDRSRRHPAAGDQALSLQLSISEDKVHFATVAEPIILYDEYNWQRPAPTELYAYPSMIADRGFNDIREHFFLAYMYVPPDEGFQSADIWSRRRAGSMPPRAAFTASAHRVVALDRCRRPHLDDDRPDGRHRRHSYKYDIGVLALSMTAAPPTRRRRQIRRMFFRADRHWFSWHRRSLRRRRQRAAPAGGFCVPIDAPGTLPLLVCVRRGNAVHVEPRRL